MAYENIANWTLGENKPNSNPIVERVKLMQNVYLQRIMKKITAKGYEKTNPKQTQFKPNFPPIQLISVVIDVNIGNYSAGFQQPNIANLILKSCLWAQSFQQFLLNKAFYS